MPYNNYAPLRTGRPAEQHPREGERATLPRLQPEEFLVHNSLRAMREGPKIDTLAT
jgi:hypothetical protein